ncbi:MAG: DUF5916 domain-containing protein, partial [Terriglobales bacterium]
IEPITKFIQTTPDEGAPVSQRTEAYIFYDDDNIYLGFKFWDDPKLINHRMAGHDTPTGSDSADFLIDTFRDRRTGYWFSISAGGVEFDGTVNDLNGNGGFESIDFSWDGIWQAKSVVEDWGWSAEVVIPFKSIRMSRASTQDWGINICREILRRQEFAYMVPVPRYEGGLKPSRTATMELDHVHVGRNLEIIPFFSSAYRSGGRQPELQGYKADGGLDVRYGLSANLTANLTINPDFADTEADEFTPSLSRFEIFFPEKRKFFTEGANYFKTPFDLFFSRRVGERLSDGDPQRILQGGKITGRAGRWTIGGLEAFTQERKFIDPGTQMQLTAPGAFFGVVRLQHDIFQKSAIGFMSVVRRQGSGDIGQNESTHGVDVSLLKGQHLAWNSQFIANSNDAHPGINGQHLGWISQFAYGSNTWDYGVAGEFLGREVDMSNTGFEPQTDRWSGQSYVHFKPFINRDGIRQLTFGAAFLQSNGTRGEIEDSAATGTFQVQFKNFWQAQVQYSYNRTRFFGFTPAFAQLPTTRLYLVPYTQYQVSTPQSGIVTFTAYYEPAKIVQYNEGFYGRSRQGSINATARLGNRLRWQVSAVDINESLLTGVHFQHRQFYLSRVFYQFSPKWRARVLAQYAKDRHGNNLSWNSLVAYDFTARSAFYVGYNRQRRLPFDPGDLGNQVFMKMSYLFGF